MVRELPKGATAAAIQPIGAYHWPGGVVPYAIDPALDDVDRVYRFAAGHRSCHDFDL